MFLHVGRLKGSRKRKSKKEEKALCGKLYFSVMAIVTQLENSYCPALLWGTKVINKKSFFLDTSLPLIIHNTLQNKAC